MRTALLACGAVICCCVVLAWQPGSAAAKNAGLDKTERKVVKLVNRIRGRNGLRRLKASPTLATAASVHTGDMLRSDFLGHASSDGTPMPSRVRRYTAANWVGESVAAVSRRGSTARRVVRMWMASPPHRSILLSSSGRRIGVGKRAGRLGAAKRAVFTADLASRH